MIDFIGLPQRSLNDFCLIGYIDPYDIILIETIKFLMIFNHNTKIVEIKNQRYTSLYIDLIKKTSPMIAHLSERNLKNRAKKLYKCELLNAEKIGNKWFYSPNDDKLHSDCKN